MCCVVDGVCSVCVLMCVFVYVWLGVWFVLELCAVLCCCGLSCVVRVGVLLLRLCCVLSA